MQDYLSFNSMVIVNLVMLQSLMQHASAIKKEDIIIFTKVGIKYLYGREKVIIKYKTDYSNTCISDIKQLLYDHMEYVQSFIKFSFLIELPQIRTRMDSLVREAGTEMVSLFLVNMIVVIFIVIFRC